MYPSFDDNLRHDLRTETELFLGSQLSEDRGATELLTANYSYINERLARHYGIPGVFGSHFRRVTLKDENRFGLLGQAGILTITSYNDRTSVVRRGYWIMDRARDTTTAAATERAAAQGPSHGNAAPTNGTAPEQSRLFACHSRMDPLGFALEHYDAIGRYRTTDAKQPIDASGLLSDGSKFSGPESFRAALLPRREQFVATPRTRAVSAATAPLGVGGGRGTRGGRAGASAAAGG